MKKLKSFAKALLPLVLLFVIVASAVTSTRAQDQNQFVYLPVAMKIDPPRWIGPEGGSVTVLVTDPSNSSVLYAGSRGTGVFKTTNGGASWTKANSGISTFTINSLAIDPDNTAIIYAGTEGQLGVYKSTDRGATWTPANKGIKANSNVLALAVNPGNSTLVYAATQTMGTNDGVLYKSTDSGANWTAVLSQTGDWISSLSIDPSKPYYILAASQTKGPYIASSTSYGGENSWGTTNINNLNCTDCKTGLWVWFDDQSTTDQAYYVAKGNDLYRSTDNGKNWTLKYDGPASTVVSRNGLSTNPFDRNILYMATSSSDAAGVLRSDNKGDSWQAAGLKGKKVNTVVVSRANRDTVFAGTEQDGVFKSTDRGTNWTPSTTGLGSSYVTGMVFSGPSTFYAGTYGGGIYKTTNGGTSWAGFNTNLNDRLINGLAQHPAQANIIFALTANSGLYRNDLNGTSGWQPVGGLPQAFEQANVPLRDDPAMAAATAAVGTNAMAFAPSNANIAYLATNGGGVYASSDGAASFTPRGLAGELVKNITVNENDPDILYVTVNTGITNVVKRSDDGGDTWQTLPSPDGQLQQTINAVAMWPGEDDSVIAGTANGVWKYNGTSWEAAGLQGYAVSVLAPDLANAENMLAGTNRGAFTSSDHQNWSQIASSMGSINVASISFNPTQNAYVYIGTVDRGALQTGY